jgi:AraC-like DNA-binding protein
MSYYEKVFMTSSDLPITYHSDEKTFHRHTGFYLHWHEHVEILYFSNGEGTVYINNVPIHAKKGQMVVISSNTLHGMPTKSPDCNYHCIIINKMLVDSVLAEKNIYFQELISDEQAVYYYQQIIRELTCKPPLYQSQAVAFCSLLLGLLARKYTYSEKDSVSITKSPKLKLVKKAMGYIMTNYQSDLTIEEIAEYIGCSKYYLCHIFKEMTGQTMIDYINILRCNQIKRLITNEDYSITEAALLCGFHNLSYLTKIYKKHMGILPSQERKNTNLIKQ